MNFRIIICLIHISLLFSPDIYAQVDLMPVKTKGKFGFIDTSGTVIYPCVFDRMSAYGDTLYILEKNGLEGYYNSQNGIFCEPRYLKIIPLEGSFMTLKNTEGKWGTMLHDSILTPDFVYDTAWYNSYSIVLKFKEKYISYSNDGILQFDTRADSVIRIGWEYAFFRRDNHWGIVNQDREIVPPMFDSVWTSNMNVSYLKKGDSLRAFIPNLNKLVKVEKDSKINLLWIYDGDITVSYPPQFYYLENKTQKRLYSTYNPDKYIDLIYFPDLYFTLRSGFFILEQDNSMMLFDSTLKVYLKDCSRIDPVDSRFFRYYKDGTTSIYDASQEKYDSQIENINRITDTTSSMVFYLIDTPTGIKIADSTFSTLPGLPGNISSVNLIDGKGFQITASNLKGIISFKGKTIIPLRYDEIDMADSNLYVVSKNSKYGLCRPDGTEVLAPLYEELDIDENYSVKAYWGKNLKIFQPDRNFNMKLTSQYNNIRRLKINFRGIRKANPITNRPGGMSSYKWLRDSVTGKMGLIEVVSGIFVISPKYDMIEYLPQKNVTITYINCDTVFYNLGGMTFYTTRLAGLVSTDEARIIADPSNICIWVNDLMDYKNTDGLPNPNAKTRSNLCRAIDNEGNFVLLGYYGQIIRPRAVYISSPKTGDFMSWYGDSIITVDSVSNECVETCSKFYASARSFLHPYNSITQEKINHKKAALKTINCEKFTIHRYAGNGSAAKILTTDLQSRIKKFQPHAEFPYEYKNSIQDDDYYRIASISEAKKLFGFVDEKGEIAIDIKYQSAEAFSSGYALVREGGQDYFIDYNGNDAFGLRFSKASSFSDGMAAVKIKTKWGYIDTSGNIVIEPVYNSAGEYSEGLAAVRLNNVTQYINTEGTVIFSAGKKKGEPFRQGTAIVTDASKSGLINLNGELVLKCKFDFISEPDNMGRRIVRDGKNTWVIDKMGEKCSAKYKDVLPTYGNYYVVRGKSGYGLADSSMKLLIKPVMSSPVWVGDGYAVIRDRKKNAYFELNTKDIKVVKSEKLFPFSSGVAFYTSGQSLYKIDTNLEVLDSIKISPDTVYLPTDQFGTTVFKTGNYFITVNSSMKIICKSRIKPFKVGEYLYALSDTRGKYYIYDSGKNQVYSLFHYGKIDTYSEKLSKVTIFEMEGYADIYGRIFVKPQYTDIAAYRKGIFRIYKGDKFGYIRDNGTLIWEPSH